MGASARVEAGETAAGRRIEKTPRMLFELRSVSVRLGGALVLDRVSLSIPAGFTALVGPSGAGKSTLLRLLNRLVDPDRGEVLLRGRDLREHDPLALRLQVGLVPQLPALLAGTVASNVAYAAALAGREADTPGLLERAGLDPALAGRDVTRLSVGEQQCAMLARALAQGPEVLLLDEPTSALDPAARGAVEATLQRLRMETDLSLVLVTHDRSQAARMAERLIELRAGSVAAGVGGEGGAEEP
jgi:putative ABC transport system ATP-binding protein